MGRGVGRNEREQAVTELVQVQALNHTKNIRTAENIVIYIIQFILYRSGSVAEWLACWTQAQKARIQIAVATLSGNSLRQTVHTHCASVHQSSSNKIGSSPLKGCGGNCRPSGKYMAAYRRVYDSRHLQSDCQEPGSAPEPYAR